MATCVANKAEEEEEEEEEPGGTLKTCRDFPRPK